MWTSRRAQVVGVLCAIPLIGYVIYIIGLQETGIRLVREFGSLVSAREQADLLFAIGRVEIGVLVTGLVAIVLSYYKDGDVDRALLVYALVGILGLAVVFGGVLNAYYQYVVDLLRL